MKRFLLVFMLLCSNAAMALEITAGDYRGRDDVAAFVQRLALESQYSEAELIKLFSQVEKQSHLFAKLDKPAEKELAWHQYRRIFIKEKRISRGVEFWQRHRNLLAEIRNQTGVPEEIIIAIIGVETFYGIYKGSDPVFDSLVTIAFDYPRRAKFFTRELEEFLLLAKEQNFNPRELYGSYAGAMGLPQFISSSYRNYAVDYDGDGQVDLFNSIPDITASVANYFVKHGWRKGESVAQSLTLSKNVSVSNMSTGFKLAYQWQDLREKGFTSNASIGDQTRVALVKLMQPKQAEYWAGLKNFYVITRYNHSELYAMAVHQLAQLIRQQYEAVK